jgi:hypothetical protein
VAGFVFVLAFRGLFLLPLLLVLVFEGFGSFLGRSFLFCQFHMGWLSSDISVILLFFASKALFSAFEIVIGARAAFPSTIWEIKRASFLLGLDYFFLYCWGAFSQDLSKVCNLDLLECI